MFYDSARYLVYKIYFFLIKTPMSYFDNFNELLQQPDNQDLDYDENFDFYFDSLSEKEFQQR